MTDFSNWFFSWESNYYNGPFKYSTFPQLSPFRFPRKHLIRTDLPLCTFPSLSIYTDELDRQGKIVSSNLLRELESKFSGIIISLVKEKSDANFLIFIDKLICPSEESFELQVRENKILIVGHDYRGIISAIESFISLIFHSSHLYEQFISLPALALSDSPRIQQRAVMISLQEYLHAQPHTFAHTISVLSKLRINTIFLLCDSSLDTDAEERTQFAQDFMLCYNSFALHSDQHFINLVVAFTLENQPSFRSICSEVLRLSKAEKVLLLSKHDDSVECIEGPEFQNLISELTQISSLKSLVFALNESSRDLLGDQLDILHFPVQVYDIEDVLPSSLAPKPVVFFQEYLDNLWQHVSDSILEENNLVCFPLSQKMDSLTPQLPNWFALAFFSYISYAGERYLHLLESGLQEQLAADLFSIILLHEKQDSWRLHSESLQRLVFMKSFYLVDGSEIVPKQNVEQSVSYLYLAENIQLPEIPSRDDLFDLHRVYQSVLKSLKYNQSSSKMKRFQRDAGSNMIEEYKHYLYVMFSISRALFYARSIAAKDESNLGSNRVVVTNAPITADLNPAQQKRAAVYDNVDMTRRFEIKIHPKTENITKLLINVVQQNILFRNFKSEEHTKIVEAFEFIRAKAGEIIIKQGDSGEYFYIVESGKLEVYMESCGLRLKVGRTLDEGDYFGELALMYNTPRAATVITVEDSNLWRIDRQTYRTIVTHHNKETSDEFFGLVSNVHILGKRLGDVLSHAQLSKVVSTLEIEEFDHGSVIIRQHQTGDYFYIISEGQVDVWQEAVLSTSGGVLNRSMMGTKLVTLKRGDYFGEKALLADDVRQASCIAVGKVICLSLSRDDFIAMIGSWQDITNVDHIQSLAAKKAKIRESVYDSQYHITLHLDDIEQLNTLGVGAFGKVKVARHKSTAQLYALKAQSKAFIVSQNMQEMILNEMHIMKQIDHPFISKLHASIQDRKYIYFLLELLPGGEFFSFLQSAGRLSEDKSRFYSASVVLALEELHKNKIAYRDLKPENMVMDGRGYVKLVDFGLAKHITAGSTWTMCGTPDYLAPEIILNKGHNYAVDYWALGVLIFEMMHGWPPFYHDQPMKVYEKIILGKVDFPASFSKPLEDIIAKFLVTNPSKRLGNMKGSINDIFKHKWYGSFDWQGLLLGTLSAPSVPDLSTFDSAVAAGADDEDDSDDVEDSDWEPLLM